METRPASQPLSACSRLHTAPRVLRTPRSQTASGSGSWSGPGSASASGLGQPCGPGTRRAGVVRACEGRGCLQRITPSAARLPALPESEVHTAVWAATRGAPGRLMCRIEPRLNPSQPTVSRKVPRALSAEEWPRSSLGGWSLALNRPARGPTILAASRATTPFWREGQGGECMRTSASGRWWAAAHLLSGERRWHPRSHRRRPGLRPRSSTIATRGRSTPSAPHQDR